MSSFCRRSSVTSALIVATMLVAASAHAQLILKLNDNVNFRFGMQFQVWGDSAQDAATKTYQENLFIRRARLLLTGQMAPNVTFFFQTDNPNIGKVPKALGSGFILQDGWAEWKINKAAMLSGGLMIVPLNRAALTSTASFITLDISPTAVVNSAPTGSSGTRDTGFQLKGIVFDDRFEYRLGAFQGLRDAATTTSVAGHNAFRKTVYVQYNFLDKESGYVFNGTNLGTKKIFNLSAGYDRQKSYKSYSAAAFTNLPVAGGDEIAGILQLDHYDGGKYIASLPRQRDYVLEAGYYLHQVKFQPFAKWESQKFNPAFTPSKDQTRYGLGGHYYIYGQSLKVTGQYLHVKPRNSALNSTNEFTVELQFRYY